LPWKVGGALGKGRTKKKQFTEIRGGPARVKKRGRETGKGNYRTKAKNEFGGSKPAGLVGEGTKKR